MSKIADKLHALLHEVVAKFEAARHPAAAELHAIHDRLTGDGRQLATEAAVDARHVEADAEHAAAPVVAEVKIDGAQLYKVVKANTLATPDAKTATEPAAAVQPPAAPNA